MIVNVICKSCGTEQKVAGNTDKKGRSIMDTSFQCRYCSSINDLKVVNEKYESNIKMEEKDED